MWPGLSTACSAHPVYSEAGHWLGDYESLGVDDKPVGSLADDVLYYIERDHLVTS